MKTENKSLGPKKVIGICHYKVGRTDGVSLEILKREKMLKEVMGHEVILIAGTSGFSKKDKENHKIELIPELDFDFPKGHRVIDTDINIENIKRKAFNGFELEDDQKDKSKDELEAALFNDIYKVSNLIVDRFFKIFGQNDFDYLFLHNIFSHGRHIAAAMAFYTIIKKINAKVIAVHHDFYEDYEGRYLVRNESRRVQMFLDKYVPPSLPGIKHVTINSIKQDQLENKLAQKGARPEHEIIVFPDTFNFDQDEWKEDGDNKDFLRTFNIKKNDLLILQATRIVRRKAIELTIDLIAELNKRKNELIGRRLYNNKTLTNSSAIILAFAQAEEQDAVRYKQELIDLMHDKGVQYRFLYGQIESERNNRDDNRKYRLWDAYVFADMISYPSIWEGFGNQFLEAVFAKKPIILYEYPVFIEDIWRAEYFYVSLGRNKTAGENKLVSIPPGDLKKAVASAIDTLVNPRTLQRLEQNFEIAKKCFGNEKLKEMLMKCLE